MGVLLAGTALVVVAIRMNAPLASGSRARSPQGIAAARVQALAGHPRLGTKISGELPTPLEGAAMAGSLLVGGLVDGQASTRTVRRLPSLSVWGRLAVGMHDTAAAWVHGSLYILGGGLATGPTATIWRLSPPRTAVAIGSLPEPLSDQAGVTLGRVTYIFGGFTGRHYARSILAFTPPASVRRVGRLPVGLRYAAAATLRGRIYLAGGLTPGGLTDQVLRFDPKTGSITALHPLPAPLMYATLWATDGQLVLLGGRTPSGFTDQTWLMNPRTGRVTTLAPLGSPRGYAMVWSSGSQRALLMGGRSNRQHLSSILTLRIGSQPLSKKGAHT